MTTSTSRRTRRRVAFLAAILSLVAADALRAQTHDATPDVRGLPIIELPARGTSTDVIAVFLTGDGGWADLDRHVSQVFADHGVNVVGLNTRDYLWRKKTPEQAATDVERLARAYMMKWNAHRVMIVGYSRGADIMPFVATRLSADFREHVTLLAMLGLADAANFHFHLTDVIKDVSRSDDLPIAPELSRLRGQRMLCVYGTEEKNSGCRDADSTLITKVPRRGDHHLDRDYRSLGELILQAASD